MNFIPFSDRDLKPPLSSGSCLILISLIPGVVDTAGSCGSITVDIGPSAVFIILPLLTFSLSGLILIPQCPHSYKPLGNGMSFLLQMLQYKTSSALPDSTIGLSL